MAAETASADAPAPTDAYDGEPAVAIAARLALPAVVAYQRVRSTMDVAHALAEAGAAAGTLVVANEQTAGRGRQGRLWRSDPSHGLWLTLLERPNDRIPREALSLRLGIAAARALDAYSPVTVRVKWPNDLFVGGGKLAGVLVEARWRGDRPEWIAIGVGVNVIVPHALPGAAGLREGVSRLDVLTSLVPALRAAAVQRGPLDGDELAEFERRDYARGRRCVSPSVGVVLGVTATGELAVETGTGVRYHRAGSLLLEEAE